MKNEGKKTFKWSMKCVCVSSVYVYCVICLIVSLAIFLIEVLLMKVFSLRVFLGESLVKCFSRKPYKCFFNYIKVLSKFCSTFYFSSKHF